MGILTGRSIKAARYRYAETKLPKPAVWICQAGTEIYYGDEKRTWIPFIKEVNDVLIAILEKYHDKIQIIYKFSGKCFI